MNTKKEMMNCIVLWSAMRSGSTEFARDIAQNNQLRYADELLNRGLSKYNPKLLNTSNTRLVFKLFAEHDYHLLQGKPCCTVVLERSPSQRWCSLRRARRTGDWKGKKRQGCEQRPPKWFIMHHRQWIQKAPRQHLYLTFEEVTLQRALSLNSVKSYCKINAT